ncbi:MAG: hypothetical protein IJ012_06055 [Clostridia bacterium]|nr:hypothetical protein [Clostridia bacterium]
MSVQDALACLPEGLWREIERLGEGYGDFYQRLFEVRLRAGHHAALTVDGRSLPLAYRASAADVAATLSALCAHSVYAHKDTLREGYLYAFGCRVGVAGRAVTDGGRVVGIADVCALCIRIPHRIAGAGEVAVRAFRRMGCRRGVLIYSPPGVGKTTMLTDLAYTLSAGRDALRVAVVDTRGELYGEDAPAACQIDVLRGYPKAVGIEIATRVLAPQVIVCDEIGDTADAAAIFAAVGAGVPLIASAHADGLLALRARPPLRTLIEGGVFGAYIGIAREGDKYSYTVEGEGLCQD